MSAIDDDKSSCGPSLSYGTTSGIDFIFNLVTVSCESVKQSLIEL